MTLTSTLALLLVLILHLFGTTVAVAWECHWLTPDDFHGSPTQLPTVRSGAVEAAKQAVRESSGASTDVVVYFYFYFYVCRSAHDARFHALRMKIGTGDAADTVGSCILLKRTEGPFLSGADPQSMLTHFIKHGAEEFVAQKKDLMPVAIIDCTQMAQPVKDALEAAGYSIEAPLYDGDVNGPKAPAKISFGTGEVLVAAAKALDDERIQKDNALNWDCHWLTNSDFFPSNSDSPGPEAAKYSVLLSLGLQKADSFYACRAGHTGPFSVLRVRIDPNAADTVNSVHLTVAEGGNAQALALHFIHRGADDFTREKGGMPPLRYIDGQQADGAALDAFKAAGYPLDKYTGEGGGKKKVQKYRFSTGTVVLEKPEA